MEGSCWCCAKINHPWIYIQNLSLKRSPLPFNFQTGNLMTEIPIKNLNHPNTYTHKLESPQYIDTHTVSRCIALQVHAFLAQALLPPCWTVHPSHPLCTETSAHYMGQKWSKSKEDSQNIVNEQIHRFDPYILSPYERRKPGANHKTQIRP